MIGLRRLALIAVLIPWRGALEVEIPPPGVSAARARLVAALGPMRLTRGRITGGLGYLPLEERATVEAGQVFGVQVVPTLRLSERQERLVSSFVGSSAREPTPRELGDLAFRALLSSDWIRKSKAEQLLEEATAEAPRDAALLSDLAASYLEGGRRRVQPRERMALSAANHAVATDPNLIEARFNLALALERCGLFEKAKLAWFDYLRRDPASGWSEEARQHLADLRQPTPSQRWFRRWKGKVLAGTQDIPQDLWEAAREESRLALLERWSSSVLRKDAKAAQAELSAARTVAELLDEQRHDSSLLHAVRDVDSADRRAVSRSLAEGYRAFAKGEHHYLRMELALARPYFEAAERLLALHRSPFEPWATARLAEIACEEADYRRAQRLLLRIRSRAHPWRDPNLSSQQFWVEGLIYLNQAQLSSAALAFDSFKHIIGDKEQEAKVALSLAEAREPVDPNEWFSRSSARGDLEATSPLSQRFRFLDSLSQMLVELDPEAADVVAQEELIVAEKAGVPAWRVRALLRKAQMEASKKDWRQARSDLGSAGRWIALIPDSILKERLGQEALLARSKILPGALPEAQLPAMKRALQYWGRHYRLNLPRVRRSLADTYLNLRQPRPYEQELHRALRFHEDLIRSWGFGQSVLRHRAGDLLDALAIVHLERGQVEEVLSLEERARTFPGLPRREAPTVNVKASDPLTQLGYAGGNPRSYSESEFSGGLPQGMAVIEFQHKGERIWAWLFRRGRVHRYYLPVSASTLRRHLPPSLSRPGFTFHFPRFHSNELSRWLLKPLHSALPLTGDLIFLNDALLDSVAWHQLTDPSTGRALARDHEIISAVKPEGVTTGGRMDRGTLVARSLLLGSRGAGAAVPQRQSPQLAEPITARELKARLPPTSTLVEYAFIGDRLVAWVIRRSEIRFAALPADRERCLRLVRRYLLSTVQGRARSVRILLDELGEILIDPIRPLLPSSGSLVFSPEESFLQLPFAALTIQRGGPPLLEAFTISVVTSATQYMLELDDAPRADHGTWKALIVANPISKVTRTWDSTSAGAAKESEEIRRLFPGSKVMEGFDAITSNPLLRESFEIVHYSGHWDLRHDPYDDTMKPGMLPEPSKVRLAVLAACGTGADSGWHGPTSYWIPGRLLAGNVPAVVATLWSVDDSVTAHLMVRFYRHLRSGKDAGHALQAAQLELLKSKSSTLRKVSSWGGFQLYGYGGV